MKKLYLDYNLFNKTEEKFLTIKEFYCKAWNLNGKLHRDDGPAVIWSDGRQEWWIDGNRHRIDGPAIITGYGEKFWFYKGEEIPDRNIYNFFPLESYYLNEK